jgi:hypothetical protein
MSLPAFQQDLAEMVKVALKEANPQMYRDLDRENELEQFAAERAGQMREAAGPLHFRVTQRAQHQALEEGKDPIQVVAAVNMALHQADEYLLATYLEFPTSQQDLEEQPGPPVMSIKSPSGIRYLPKVQKDKDGKWEISSPYLRELSAKKNTGDSEKT